MPLETVIGAKLKYLLFFNQSSLLCGNPPVFAGGFFLEAIICAGIELF
jgi:hypothetical protein